MAYKLRFPDGLMLEVDSPDELRHALAIVRRAERSRPASTPNAASVQSSSAPPPQQADQTLLRRFLRATSGRQRMVLDRLAQSQGALTDVSLRTALGVESNAELAGTMSGLSKNARKLHFSIDQVLVKTRDGSHYHYAMTELMRTVMPDG